MNIRDLEIIFIFKPHTTRQVDLTSVSVVEIFTHLVVRCVCLCVCVSVQVRSPAAPLSARLEFNVCILLSVITILARMVSVIATLKKSSCSFLPSSLLTSTFGVASARY